MQYLVTDINNVDSMKNAQRHLLQFTNTDVTLYSIGKTSLNSFNKKEKFSEFWFRLDPYSGELRLLPSEGLKLCWGGGF